MDDVSYLLAQAERCRRLATHIGPPNEQPLLDMADEFEARAHGMKGDDPPSPIQTMIIPD
ncbi:MAG: hypothetical protein JWL96_1642 [Sphingomonas bacterium]|uniref:hypothetical protein n=1 Tax=Sphingomonas bacterium TaxID=1895847 RepID=UPI00261998C6|nr:hypothetical protein [Sphingomonas bacterium]MDB5709572.1 hypothetical protein [Sphingomonas bacterium]